jgi:hypothetical protein
MKLEYRAVGSSGGYTTLADIGDVVKEWQPDASLNSVQRENLAAAVGQNNNSYRQPLGNISTKISVELTNTQASTTLAAAFARTTVNNLLGTKNHLKATFGTEVQYYPNAVCSKCKPRYLGATTEFQIEFESDIVTATEPQ